MINRLSSYSPAAITTVVTFIIVLSSVPLNYFIVYLFNKEYTDTIFFISIVTPLIMAPGTILILIKLFRHLKYFKEQLEIEIHKNKKQDLILFEQARFVLMGEMIANISHQWKQPLNTIGLSVVAARTSQNIESKTDEYFEIIESNVQYLATTIDDFMSFFDKRTASELKSIDEIVREIKSIIYTHVSNKDIELVIQVDSTQGDIEIASSISQVVLNIINNAKDAFDDESKHREIRVLFHTSEYGLEIECCDNGKGISPEIKEKIFNPYFTTKEKSQGTGIGLYMSREIVQKFFNGQINLSPKNTLFSTNHSNKTCFYIAIPYSSNCILKKEFS